ncbi:hypothetical protein GCM10028772_24930 [Nocardioides ultimimeridianus]
MLAAFSIAKVGTTVQGGGAVPLKSYTVLSAAFDDVGTLKPQQNVKEDGVRIGQVTGIEYRDGKAHVTMRLEGDVKVYRDAELSVGNESALGRKFVSLDPGTPTSGALDGGEIPATHTRSAVDLNDALAAFPPSARKGLSTTLRNVGIGVDGGGQNLQDGLGVAPNALDDAQKILRAVNSPDANLSGLLATADQLVGQLRGHEAELGALVKDTGTTLAAVNTEDTQALRRTLLAAPSTLRTVNRGLTRIRPALDKTAHAVKVLRPGVHDLVRAMPDLRGFLREAPPVARTVVGFSREGVPAVDALTPAVTDAQYAVHHLGESLGFTDPILSVLAPYAPDAGHLFSLNTLLSGHFTPWKHYFSAELVFPGLYNFSAPDPLAKVDPYPGPGGAFAAGDAYNNK